MTRCGQESIQGVQMQEIDLDQEKLIILVYPDPMSENKYCARCANFDLEVGEQLTSAAAVEQLFDDIANFYDAPENAEILADLTVDGLSEQVKDFMADYPHSWVDEFNFVMNTKTWGEYSVPILLCVANILSRQLFLSIHYVDEIREYRAQCLNLPHLVDWDPDFNGARTGLMAKLLEEFESTLIESGKLPEWDSGRVLNEFITIFADNPKTEKNAFEWKIEPNGQEMFFSVALATEHPTESQEKELFVAGVQ